MLPTKTKLNRSIEKTISHKTFLLDFYNSGDQMKAERLEIIKNGFKLAKEQLNDIVNNLLEKSFVYDEVSSDQIYKYSLEVLEKDHSDYKLFDKCLKQEKYKGKTLKMYRVNPTDATENETKTSKKLKLLLLHGTKGSNIQGILKEGFKPSENGKFGPGVYLTNDYRTARHYGGCYVNDRGTVKKNIYLFVNEIEQR